VDLVFGFHGVGDWRFGFRVSGTPLEGRPASAGVPGFGL